MEPGRALRIPVVWCTPGALPGAPPDRPAPLWVLALRTPEHTPRAQARQWLRQAVQQALAAAPVGAGGRGPVLLAPDGARPRLAERATGLSFSHAPGLSLAAVREHGPVGVDVTPAQAPPDWPAVARDYLGPQVAQQLQAGGPHGPGFAAAWAAHEACLKLQGQPLAEWTPHRPPAGAGCTVLALPLPGPWVGRLALPGAGAPLPPAP